MLSTTLYFLQRLTALIMVPFVLIHIIVMVIAVQDGLTAAEILSRTQGSTLWFLFYGGFVVSASIHAAIGLRVIAFEWLNISGASLTIVSWVAGLLLLGLGLHAVHAVTALPL